MRRSCRDFRDAPIPLRDLSQVLWAAQGITGLGGLRTAPSPGALFALRPYVMSANVAGLPSGLYRFDPESHELIHVTSDDMRPALEKAAGGQQCVGACAAILLLAANYSRVAREYGAKAERLVHTEAGHVGQNVCLEATALGLGVIGIGAFDEAEVKAALRLPSREEAVYMLAFGWKY
jgi:SagB-type dehydrogenase family enzyme